ncbi:MAG: ACP S-malonyltransferase [Geobacter sp.]|nr:ACP S-malonyltransferase [Geobacter sp.]
MNCFMFPGQPLMVSQAFPDDPDFDAISELTRERAFLDLSALSWTKGTPTDSVKLQVYGVAMSLWHARKLGREKVRPAIVAGHSMGIYPALALCGCVSEEDILELTYRAGSCMARMGEKREYALGCVTGLTLEPLMAIAESNGVHLANYNTSRHFLLSGEKGDIANAAAEALENGAFTANTFPCDAPLHTPLMEEVATPLREIFSGYRYAEPLIPIMNHIDQDVLSASEIPDFLIRELCEPVYWEQTYRALHAAGATRFFEVGAGDSLKKYNRWIQHEMA